MRQISVIFDKLKNKKIMKNYYVIMLIATCGEKKYKELSNFYFETKTEAEYYAKEIIKKNTIFKEYEIKKILPYK